MKGANFNIGLKALEEMMKLLIKEDKFQKQHKIKTDVGEQETKKIPYIVSE